MDRLDKISTATIVILVCISMWLITWQALKPESEPSPAGTRSENIRFINPALDQKIQVARNLLLNNSQGESEKLLQELVAEFPYEGRLYMLMGDLYLRKQLPLEAMLEYRKAVDLNPDFLDKKTKLFEGKKIKNTLLEAKEKILAGLANDPGNEKLKEQRKVLYYMQRKVAGSCG